MNRFTAWCIAKPYRLVLLGAGLPWAVVLIVTSIIWISSLVQPPPDQASPQAADHAHSASDPSYAYTAPPPVTTLTSFYSKHLQTSSSRLLNEQLYALTSTIDAPNTPTTVKGEAVVGWGSFGDFCAVRISHTNSDPAGAYNISIYSYAGADQQALSSKNAFDIDPSRGSTTAPNSIDVAVSRDHASLKGLNYLLTQSLKRCSSQPVSSLPQVPTKG